MPATAPAGGGVEGPDARRPVIRTAGPLALAAATAIALPLVLGDSYWLHIVI